MILMFRFERTVTSRPPTVLSSPPSRLGDEDFDCTMTLTRPSPFPDRSSLCRSGEILLSEVDVLAARAFVLLEMNSAEHNETSTAAVTSRFRAWGRDIQLFSRGHSSQKTSARQNAS